MADSSGFVLVDQVETDIILNNTYFANKLSNFNENFVSENKPLKQNQPLESSLVSGPSNAYEKSSQLIFNRNKHNFNKQNSSSDSIQSNGVNSATLKKVKTKQIEDIKHNSNIKECNFNKKINENIYQPYSKDKKFSDTQNITSVINEVPPDGNTELKNLENTVLGEYLNMSFLKDLNSDEKFSENLKSSSETKNEPDKQFDFISVCTSKTTSIPSDIIKENALNTNEISTTNMFEVINMPLLTNETHDINSSSTSDSVNINTSQTTEVSLNLNPQITNSHENDAKALHLTPANTTVTGSNGNKEVNNNVDKNDIVSHGNNPDENDIKATSNDIGYNTNTTNKRVKFPEGAGIVSGYMDPPIPWRDASVCTTESMLKAYMKSCQKHNAKPLPSLISQLKAIGDFMERNETLTLRNEHLDSRQCECLEEVLSRVQFRTIDLENTHLDDEGAIIMFDMIEYYESCIRLNVFMNTCIESRGWQACSHLIRKSTSLEQVDLGRTNISEHMVPFMLRAFKLSSSLTVLRLENCLMSGRPLATLVLALKVNTVLKQLYLGNNKLNPLDCMQLHSLLNFNRTLNLLDLRNNSCQDTGVEQLSRGIVEQSREKGGLETLVLWNNSISHHSMPCLANALIESKSLLGLNLGMNVALTNEGVHCLKDALVRNRSLLKLGFQSCRLTCEGAVAIAEFIAETKTLLRVDLRGNDIKTGGLMALTLSLKVNRSLLQLDLDKNPKKENKLKNFVGQQKQLLNDIANFIVRNNKLHTQDILRRSKEEEEKKNINEKNEIKKDKEHNNGPTEYKQTTEKNEKKENEDDVKNTEPSLQKENQLMDEASTIVDSVQEDGSHPSTNTVEATCEVNHNVECNNDDVTKVNGVVENNAEVGEVKCNVAQKNLLRNKLSLDLIKDQESFQTSCAQISPSQPQNIPSDQTSNDSPFNSDHLSYLQTPPSPHPNDVIPLSPVVLSSGVSILKSVGLSNLIASPTDVLVGEFDDGKCRSTVYDEENRGDESKNIDDNKERLDGIIESKSNDKDSCGSKDEEEIRDEFDGDNKERKKKGQGLGSDSSSWESLNSFTTNKSLSNEDLHKIKHNVHGNNIKKESKGTSKLTPKKVLKKKKKFIVTPATMHHHRHPISNSRNENHNDNKNNHKNSESKTHHTYDHNVKKEHDNTDKSVKHDNDNVASNENFGSNNEA